MSRPGNIRRRRRSREIALLIETSNSYSRQLLQGIRQYVREQGQWSVHLTEQGRGNVPPRWLAHWHGDGIIARIENRAIERAVRQVGCPVVNCSAAGLAPDFPTVISNSQALTRLAAEHLLERGFRHFAFCGDRHHAWSNKHERNFVAHLRAAGHDCAVFDSRPRDFVDWEQEQRKLAKWIRSLPKPVGIMACYDIRGQEVLELCRQLSVPVPEEVAVISQHNDDLLCELCDPPLSSVIPNPRGAGYEAAALLDRMMKGERLGGLTVEMPPLGIAVRQSTDVVAVQDSRLAAAIRFIRDNACRDIRVSDVLKAVPMSRTLLERSFKSQLGCAPYEQIRKMRIERVKELLASSNLPMWEIAERTGFASAEYLSAVFKAQTHSTPRDYRRQHQLGGGPASRNIGADR